jgi:hypothetical protein
MADDGTGITLATLQGRRNKAADADGPDGQHVDDSWPSTFPDVGLTEVSPGAKAETRTASQATVAAGNSKWGRPGGRSGSK